MTTGVYTVRGMTCDHCVRAVTDELGTVAGVTGVEVELASGAGDGFRATGGTGRSVRRRGRPGQGGRESRRAFPG